MIDEEGFRQGVGIILANERQELFLGKRIGKPAWQFPQGGIKIGETPEEALFRELWEEVGLHQEDVRILSSSRKWLRYRLPERLVRRHSVPLCVGQKQKWFLLQMVNPDHVINLAATDNPEFDSWNWVPYWYPLTQVVSFKRRVYGQAMREFAPIILVG